MSSIDDQLNRATVRLCREADRALLDFLKLSGEHPGGIDLNMLASRIALWDLEDSKSGGVIAWIVAWIAVVVVAASTWREKIKAGRSVIRTTWATARGLYGAIRLALSSDRHVVFHIEQMIRMVS